MGCDLFANFHLNTTATNHTRERWQQVKNTMKKLFLILSLLIIISCSHKENLGIKEGTFELYEKDSLIGKIYRQGNFQLENYQNGIEIIAKIEHKTDSTYLISGIEKIQSGIDSIVWLNKYWKLSNGKYRIKAVAFNANLNYEYNAVMMKVNEKIEEKYLKKLDSLNKK